MKQFKWRPLAALLVVVGLASVAEARPPMTFLLFNGEARDSTEHSSKWIPVEGANRIVIKTSTTKSAFGLSTEADSLFSDSLQTFRTLFADSVLFMARDSSGTIVTSRSSYTSPSNQATAFPMCVDTVAFAANFADSNLTMIGGGELPVNKILRSAANGGGVVSYIYPVLVNTVATVWGEGAIPRKYMRVKVTPLRRMTANTAGATGCPGACGTRVNGVKGFRMTATVYYEASSQQ